ncbi:MAG: iron-sulfur cluster repair di-iron protein [Ectobacillus sp.]
METAFTKQSSVGDIVTVFPKASDIFKASRIDFCCGGNKTLEEATEGKAVSCDELLVKLNTLYAQYQAADSDRNWNEAAFSEIIDHIIHTHHKYLNEELPQLSPYVTKVLRVHGDDQPHLAQVHSLFNQLKTELEQHTIKEEMQVFPLIVQYEQLPTEENLQKATAALEELEKEHDAAGDIMKTLRDITHDFTPPLGACRTYQMVYKRLEELENDLFQHVHLENNVLFKRLMAL